eukprot:CAMPEP_0174330768 /NCGR_PEP_ID=MMETSP0810-20121108/16932_1 /TAXON_ID=73025 ORGANISM="Eutreptiella gymnastica-like, Strain CCMP1594" /NCGR_SAMPLE_ID=MMETSP0810 /ASSEMBLY_ACC=CAM_ASM_000659 /LENGTH=95 /DNA_ID=CAMNT_0015446115 /DNA_START=52 /DNA_END=336 /DNA_ORIENTATION=+
MASYGSTRIAGSLNAKKASLLLGMGTGGGLNGGIGLFTVYCVVGPWCSGLPFVEIGDVSETSHQGARQRRGTICWAQIAADPKHQSLFDIVSGFV